MADPAASPASPIARGRARADAPEAPPIPSTTAAAPSNAGSLLSGIPARLPVGPVAGWPSLNPADPPGAADIKAKVVAAWEDAERRAEGERCAPPLPLASFSPFPSP